MAARALFRAPRCSFEIGAAVNVGACARPSGIEANGLRYGEKLVNVNAPFAAALDTANPRLRFAELPGNVSLRNPARSRSAINRAHRAPRGLLRKPN
jgi:hypothetical protein